MVFAPRGAGKSAQRRMVEISSPGDEVLCVTYDDFRNRLGRIPVRSTIADHQLNVARLTVVGLLTWLSINGEAGNHLTPDEKTSLRRIAISLLGTVSQPELVRSLKAIRNLPDRAKEVWNENRWILTSVLSGVNIATGGIGGGTLPAADDHDYELAPGDALEALATIARTLGFKAIYVLIDRIDETAETQSNGQAAYTLVAPLMHDLRLLEHRPYAFKFFVPDYIYPQFEESGGRSDRIKTFHTKWRNHELLEMMGRRLNVFSNGKLSDLSEVVSPEDDASDLVFISLCFAAGSPRDLIRIWGRALDEQLRSNDAMPGITLEAMMRAVDAFANERAIEIATASVLRDLTRLGQVDFTVSEVANDILHVQTNAARRSIQIWDQRGIVRQVGDLSAGRGRPHHHFSVIDMRVARSMFPAKSLVEFMADKARYCRTCDSWTMGDWDDPSGQRPETCIDCGAPLEVIFENSEGDD
ncbi:MAG TPA: hypothetical protein VI759_02385 [Dehalococcoidia bacterium]|nr:hypothetical protein [Dehalococcoidia bacterium]